MQCSKKGRRIMGNGKLKRTRNKVKAAAMEASRAVAHDTHLEIIQNYIQGII